MKLGLKSADNSGVYHDPHEAERDEDQRRADRRAAPPDPEFRVEWERTALARAVAVAIVRYRSDHDLSQRELAQRLGMKQPQVARLELGEVNPSIETLMRVASRLRIEFTIDVRPAGPRALT